MATRDIVADLVRGLLARADEAAASALRSSLPVGWLRASGPTEAVDDRGVRKPWPDSRRTRAYSGASTATRLSGWGSAVANDANTEVLAGAARLRERSRDLVRNNAFASHVVNQLVANMVGTGIKPTFGTGDPALDRDALALWEEWGRECYTSSPLDIYGVQSLAVRAWFESGEVMIRQRIRREADGLAVPLQLQLLEPDFLDSGKDVVLPTGGRIVGGIEFDPIDRRRAYWLYRDHPGARVSSYYYGESLAVSAAQIAHLYQEIRPGQCRGVPWLAPIIASLWDLGGYQDAERLRKRAEACTVAFVTGGDASEAGLENEADGIGPSPALDSAGYPVEQLSPGLVAYLPDGKDIKFNDPAAVAGYAEYVRVNLHEIAAGCDVPYEVLSNDLSQVNYSSIRMGAVQFRLLMRTLRQQVVVPFLCRPIMGWFIDIATAAGILPERETGYSVTWSEPQIEEVDRLTDSRADQIEVRNGTRSLADVIRSKGRDPDKVLAELAEERKKLAALGVVLDSDPNQTTTSGQAQSDDESDQARGQELGESRPSRTVDDPLLRESGKVLKIVARRRSRKRADTR